MFSAGTLLASDVAGQCFSTSLWRTSWWPSSPSQVANQRMNEEALFKKFFSPRPDDLGDHGLLGGGLGALQALQVPPDLLHHLLQLHDPRPLRGAAQVLINETHFCLIFLHHFSGPSPSLYLWPVHPTGEANGQTRDSWWIIADYLIIPSCLSDSYFPRVWENTRHSSEGELLWLFSLSLTILRFILTAWLLSLVPSVPNLFIFTTTGETQAQECVSDFSEWNSVAKKGYFSAVFLVIFVIPLVSSVELNITSVTDHSRIDPSTIRKPHLCLPIFLFNLKHMMLDDFTHINIFYAKVWCHWPRSMESAILQSNINDSEIDGIHIFEHFDVTQVLYAYLWHHSWKTWYLLEINFLWEICWCISCPLI